MNLFLSSGTLTNPVIQSDPWMLLLTTIALLVTTILGIASIAVTGYYARQMMILSRKATEVAEQSKDAQIATNAITEKQNAWIVGSELSQLFVTLEPADSADQIKYQSEKHSGDVSTIASYYVIAKTPVPTSGTFRLEINWSTKSPIEIDALIEYDKENIPIYKNRDSKLSIFHINSPDLVNSIFDQEVKKKHYSYAMNNCIVEIKGFLTINGETKKLELWNNYLSELHDFRAQKGYQDVFQEGVWSMIYDKENYLKGIYDPNFKP